MTTRFITTRGGWGDGYWYGILSEIVFAGFGAS